jgi:hypothetical protein
VTSLALNFTVTMQPPRFLGHGHIDIVDKPVPAPGQGEPLLAVSANAMRRPKSVSLMP